MTLKELEKLRSDLVNAENLYDQIAILNRHPNVEKLLSVPSPFKTFLQGLTPECESVLKQLAAIDQGIHPEVESAEKWRELLNALLPIDSFYRPIGGIVGYQTEVLRLLEGKKSAQPESVHYHSPVFDDISNAGSFVSEAIEWGLEALPQMAEIYPLGGAADRLHLIDEKTGLELPAAKLQFAGRPLLETLLRDLVAREWLYFRIYGKQLTTPVAMMTSLEKENHHHVMKLCEERNWFGRPKDSFSFFVQPLVPTVDDRGRWHSSEPLKLLLKPGGHGAIWKLARDEGIFQWFRTLGRTKALVRQINNPAAGLDYGLLAFIGIGCKRDMTFGFASCPRLLQSAEGMNVLVEKENGEIVLTNIEYCDFAKFGIEDRPLREGEPFSRFSSNTNILFVDLDQVEKAVERSPFPGLLINMKSISQVDESGQKREVAMGRLESTMQNLADVFVEKKKEVPPLRTEKTFVTYNQRQKTISVAKKAYVEGKSLLETTEQCFYEMLLENHHLLKECGFSLPPFGTASEYLRSGPTDLFLYHPALGPLYSIIKQKIRGGKLEKGSELILDLAEVDIEQLFIDGSFRISAAAPLGSIDERGFLRYSSQVGRCRLKNVRIVNRGVDWNSSTPFWKMDLRRAESVSVELKGNSEFFASDVYLKGSFHFVVEDGVRMTVTQENGEIQIREESVSEKSLWSYRIAKSGETSPLKKITLD